MGLLPLLDVGTLTDMWIGLNRIVRLGTSMLSGAMAFAMQASVASEVFPAAVSMFSLFSLTWCSRLIQHISLHHFVVDFVQATGVAIGDTIFQNRLNLTARKVPSMCGRK